MLVSLGYFHDVLNEITLLMVIQSVFLPTILLQYNMSFGDMSIPMVSRCIILYFSNHSILFWGNKSIGAI